MERSRFYLVCFGLFLRSMLKGTVRTFSFKIKVRMKKKTKNKHLNLGQICVFSWTMRREGGREGHRDQKMLIKNLVVNLKDLMSDGGATSGWEQTHESQEGPSPSV